MCLKRRWGVRPLFRYRVFRRYNSTFNKYLVTILVIVLAMYIFLLFEKGIKPTIISIANAETNIIAIKVVNEAINESLESEKIKYEDLILLKENTDTKMTTFQSDTVKMNKLKTAILNKIREKMSCVEWSEVKIPIGNIFCSNLFAGWGPSIPARLIPIGIIEADFKSSFQTAGINQTKHQVLVEIQGEVEIILPMLGSKMEISTTVPIAETIIVGSVPNTYINIGE